MTTVVRPQFPSDKKITLDNNQITQAWEYFFRAMLLQLPEPGSYAVSSVSPLLIDSNNRTPIVFNIDGSTTIDGSLHFPQLSGDVTNTGLTTQLANITSATSNAFVKISTDTKGRVISTSNVIASDITTLVDSEYVNVTGDTMTGSLKLPKVEFDTTYTPSNVAVGHMYWDDADKTVSLVLPGANLQIGQEQYVRIVNKSGSTISNGMVVSITGAQGNRIAGSMPIASNVVSTMTTIGVATEDIGNNNTGFVTISGLIRDLNTSSYAEGTVLYLSESSPGVLTNVKPTAPNAVVQVATVVNSHAVNGSIFVNISKLSNIDDLYNVTISSPTTNQLLQYDGTKWVNTTLSSIPSSNVSNYANALTTARNISLSTDATGNALFDGSANITIPVTLSNSGVTAGTYNSSTTQITPFTVDSKGRITLTGANVTITPTFASLTSKPTTISGYGITDAVLNNANSNIILNQNAATIVTITNTSTGTAADARIAFSNGTYNAGVVLRGTGFTGTANRLLMYNLGTSSAIDFSTGSNSTKLSIDTNVLTRNDAKLGYGANTGGTVTQLTSKSTGVTLNKPTGAITLNNAALAANTTVSFTFTNSFIAADDLLLLNIKSGATIGSYDYRVSSISAGSANISITNISGVSLSEAVVLSYAIIDGSIA